MRVTIHQPEHLPWLGFLDKARQCDVFVLLDNVQFRRHYFQNRNRVRGAAAGSVWLTVPPLSRGVLDQRIDAVEIDNLGKPGWREKWIATLRSCYGGAPFWNTYAKTLEDFSARAWTRLADFNEALIVFLFEAFGFSPRVVRASALGSVGRKGDLLLDICRRLSADEYLSGVSGRDYLAPETFKAEGIGLLFQDFKHPIYSQGGLPFMPALSSIDLLAHHGENAAAILRGVGVETMKDVFH